MIKLLIKHIPFLLLTPFLCFFSGVFFPEMGMRAAILGFCISAGVASSNILNRSNLENSKMSFQLSLLLIGFIIGIISGVLISLVPVDSYVHAYSNRRKHDGFVIVPFAFAYTLPSEIFTAAVYNILILYAYCIRFFSKFISFIAVVSAAFLSYVTIGLFPSPTPFLLTGGIIFRAFPFAILWFTAAAIADPAFTYKRWQKRTGYEEENK